MESRFMGPCIIGLAFGALSGALTGMIFDVDVINANCRHSGFLFDNAASTAYLRTNLTTLKASDIGIIEYLRYHPWWLVVTVIVLVAYWRVADILLSLLGWKGVVE